ncbi:acetoacetate--CoA ligase [Gordonia sp. TBRC 11910]|uniref:Acetoacetate--CoA ligase n=2 Tax=Gordonia asplenii TaxID=2725283 RepID=A0A848KRG5_9ACTN|nr:acetoacetate--CoA ligase [Gordonia asplenii]
MVNDNDLLWTPSAAFAEASNVTRLLDWLRTERGVDLADYPQLWQWSVDDIAAFWEALWDYFGFTSPTPYSAVLTNPVMPGAQWFVGAQINYAEQILRRARPGETAIHFRSEAAGAGSLTWDELGRQVRCVASWLRGAGVEPGDRVVSYLPNSPQAVVALLATAAVGAIWSSCSPDFGQHSVLDRFQQIGPKVLFAADGYRYGGRDFDRRVETAGIVDALPDLQWYVHVPYLDEASAPVATSAASVLWSELAPADVDRPDFSFTPTEFDHPLWIVYSSGTTGLPKPIVHGHGGITLEMSKLLHFHFDLRPGKSMFFFSTTGWVMWNIVVSSLLTGAAAVLYDGNPTHPDPDALWRMAAETGTTFFGTSPSYIGLMDKEGISPRNRYDLSKISGIMLGGSPASPEAMAWCYANIHDDIWLTSQSGGTDIASAFVGAAPTLPVHAGWIQCRTLGADVHAYSEDGRAMIGEVGELVVRQPMPSMPLYFWNDHDGARYRASYFDEFPGVWTHGDHLTINDLGECQIHGRSDSTLNRFGVRIGTAEVYRTVEALDEVDDSLVVCLNLPGGGFFMPLFVKPASGVDVDDALINTIAERLRAENSPRHVPDRVYRVDHIPYTLTGKKMEVPVRKLLLGVPVAKAANRDSMADPAALDFYVEFGSRHSDYELEKS